MSAERDCPDLSSEYLAAGALVYNIGRISMGEKSGYMMPCDDIVMSCLRGMDRDELQQRGITFEEDFFAPPGTLQGTLFTTDYAERITQTKGSIHVSQQIDNFRVISTEITGNMSEPKITNVSVSAYKNGRGRDSSIGESEAATRIGTNVAARVVGKIHSRITAPLTSEQIWTQSDTRRLIAR